MARYHPLTKVAAGERLERPADAERAILLLARQALTLAYDCGRLRRGDPEFARVRRELTSARRALAVRVRRLQELAAGEARAGLQEELNARLWKIYHAVPGEGADEGEARRIRQLVMKSIQWLADQS